MWVAPRSWVVGESVTAAYFNTQIRDNLVETLVAKSLVAGDMFQGIGPNTVARVPIGPVGYVWQVLTPTTVGWGPEP